MRRRRGPALRPALAGHAGPTGPDRARPGRAAGLAEHVGEKLIANLATLTIHSGFGSIGNAPGRLAGRLIDDGRAEASVVHLSAQSVGRPVRQQVPRERAATHPPGCILSAVESAIVDYGQKLNFVASVNELTRPAYCTGDV